MNDLRRIRIIEKKISQFGLSRKSGVHPSRISLIENDRATPTANEMNRLSKALGVVPEELFGLDTVVNSLNVNRKKDSK